MMHRIIGRTSHLRIASALFLLAACMAPPAVQATEPAPVGITGKVALADGSPLEGVHVVVSGGIGTQLTDPAGKYAVATPSAPAEYSVTPVKDGFTFAPAERTVWVSDGEAVADFTALPAAVAAQKVVIAQVLAPAFSPKKATTFVTSVTASISCLTPGAAIRYTADGTEPTAASTLYTVPLTFIATTTLKARAFKAGLADSATSSITFTKKTVATPIFFPPAPLTFVGSVKVSISCATKGAVIRFTTNGVDPTAASPIYTGPFKCVDTTTVKAKAFAAGLTDSAIGSAVYTEQAADTPTFYPFAPLSFSKSVKVHIFCLTGGATIRYTTDGTDPTAASPAYLGPFIVAATTSVKARTFKAGIPDSAVASAVYTLVP